MVKLLDIASARETIDNLNRLIVDRIKNLMYLKSNKELMKFNPGNRVRFTSRTGELKIGTVIRVNQKTISVAIDGEPGWWKVSPELLERVER